MERQGFQAVQLPCTWSDTSHWQPSSPLEGSNLASNYSIAAMTNVAMQDTDFL